MSIHNSSTPTIAMNPIWAPHVIQDIKPTDLDLYLEFSCSACIPGGGCDIDKALQVLYECGGDVKQAVEHLLSYADRDLIWTEDEIHLFERLYKLHGKNFSLISHDLSTKSIKECVKFYYLRKKLPSSIRNPTPLKEQETSEIPEIKFPCEVCGRVFEKIKSRSAHMKRHKNEKRSKSFP